MRLVLLVAGLTTLGFPTEAPAQGKLGVGLFAPEVDVSAAQRFSYAKALGQHLGAALGQRAPGRAYRSAGDLERDVRAGKIQFAVVGAVYLATKRGVTLLASARIRSKRDQVWSLLSRGKQQLKQLKGKVLQIPSLGPLTPKFVENGILGGEIRPAKYFRVKRSPDLPSAIAALKLGKAAAVVAPVSTPGLQPVVTGLRIPPLAFVAFGKQPAARVKAVKAAILRYGASLGAIHGWKGGNEGEYRALAGASRLRQRSMYMAKIEAARMKMGDILATRNLKQPGMPVLEEIFWVP